MPIRTLGRSPLLAACLSVLTARAGAARRSTRTREKWVQATLGKMTVEEKVGQLIVPSFQSTFMSTDSAEFEGW